ncbi:endonuclease [Streptomyces sp. NWU339]|uniref:YqaJ viral recombinase family nuclease n=1 Tax=Streptomyces sp. NWU339 TaxID=2185284 RepID=UPI000D67CA6C|nr:YqaJ viral recombinase family protein [Streptomyces sp. NWU339]PWI09742.1 endonuclease [Streptomyces sp. NWU339]
MSIQATEQPWTPAAVTAPDHAHGAPAARLILPAGDLDDPDYRRQWETVRRDGVGGSDVAAILGLDKYRGPRHIFEVKHGRPIESSAALSEYAEIGHDIEDFIAYLFTKRTGIPAVQTPGMLANIERPWMRSNVDRYALDPETGAVVAPVELKNRSAYQLDDWEDGVPDAPALQVHWNMAVGGWPYGWAVALVGGNTLKFHRIERDDELIETLIDVCGRWYQRHIVEGFPPSADGLEATKQLLGRLWEVKAGEVVDVPLDKARKLRKRRASLVEQIKALEDERTTVENEMRLINEAAEVVQVGNKVAWSNKQNGTFAEKRFREKHPDVAAQFVKTVEVLDVDRLKAERPDLYTKFRARILRVPSKEL